MKHCFASCDPDHYYFHFHRRYKWTAKVSKPLSSHRIDEECELDAHQTKDRVAQEAKRSNLIQWAVWAVLATSEKRVGLS